MEPSQNKSPIQNRFDRREYNNRQISQNHRENYHKFNTSDIFFRDLSSDRPQKSLQIPNKSPDIMNIQKYPQQTQTLLKVQNNNIKIENHSFSIQTHSNNLAKSHSHINLKVTSPLNVEIYSKKHPLEENVVKIEEKKIIENKEIKGNINSRNRVENETKQRIFQANFSNIFNDPTKSIYQMDQKVSLEQPINPRSLTPKVEKNRLSSNFNWLNSNTELVFQSDSKHLENGLSPLKIKIRNQYQDIDNNEILYSNINYKKNLEKINNNQGKTQNINRIIHNKSPNTDHTNKMIINNLGTLHNDDFLKNFEINSRNRDFETFQFDKFDNLDNFDMTKMKREFMRNGIHVFDTRVEGNCFNKGGKITFRIRKNDDDPEFEMKKQKLMKNLEEKANNPLHKLDPQKIISTKGVAENKLKYNNNVHFGVQPYRRLTIRNKAKKDQNNLC